jgi:hypothetical protein
VAERQGRLRPGAALSGTVPTSQAIGARLPVGATDATAGVSVFLAGFGVPEDEFPTGEHVARDSLTAATRLSVRLLNEPVEDYENTAGDASRSPCRTVTGEPSATNAEVGVRPRASAYCEP